MPMDRNKTMEEAARDVLMQAPLNAALQESLERLEMVARTLRETARERPMELGIQLETLRSVTASVEEQYARERAAREAALPVYTQKLLERPAGLKAAGR